MRRRRVFDTKLAIPVGYAESKPITHPYARTCTGTNSGAKPRSLIAGNGCHRWIGRKLGIYTKSGRRRGRQRGRLEKQRLDPASHRSG
jgi:hypothetical protein